MFTISVPVCLIVVYQVKPESNVVDLKHGKFDPVWFDPYSVLKYLNVLKVFYSSLKCFILKVCP
jgi:hypothetical protein